MMHTFTCPTCPWVSEPEQFLGSAKLAYSRHLDEAPTCAAAFEATNADLTIANLTPERFVLEAEAFDAFVAMLDAPPEPNDRLRELFNAKPPWEVT